MWVYTEIGFFSVVQHGDRPDWVVVRARREEDMEALGNLDVEIHHWPCRQATEHTPESGYPYRMPMSRHRWANVVAAMARRINYPNFKAQIQEQDDPVRDWAYHGAWLSTRKIGPGRGFDGKGNKADTGDFPPDEEPLKETWPRVETEAEAAVVDEKGEEAAEDPGCMDPVRSAEIPDNAVTTASMAGTA